MVWCPAKRLSRMPSRVIAHAKSLTRKAAKWLPQVNGRVWILVIVPFTLCVSYLLSVGAGLQHYSFAILKNNAGSIYEATYRDTLIQFPTLLAWLRIGIFWPLLVASAIISISAFTARTFRGFVILAGASLFFIVTALDIVAGLILDILTPSALFENLAANFIGGVLFSAAAAVLVATYEAIASDAINKSSNKYLYVYPIVPFLFGPTVAAIAYLIAYFFYQPMPVRLEATLGQPVTGTFSSRRTTEARNSDVGYEQQSGYFNVLPSWVEGSGAEIFSTHGRLDANWRALAREDRFVAQVSFHWNCRDDDSNDIANIRGPVAIRAESVRNIRVRFGRGFSEIRTRNSEMNRFNIETPASIFSIDREGPDGLVITNYILSEDVVRLRASGGLSFYIASTFYATRERRFPRDLEIIMDGVVHRYRFTPPRRVVPRAQVACRPLLVDRSNAALPSGHTNVQVPEGALYVGAVVRVVRVPRTPNFLPPDEELTVTGAAGDAWAKTFGVDRRNPRERRLGRARTVSFRGNVVQLLVDGNRANIGPQNEITARGDLVGTLHPSGEIHLVGPADALWKDGVRLNPTKWERLSTEAQIATLTFLLAILIAILRALRPVLDRFRRDEKLSWYP
jgi:hypothetical protein